MSTTTTTTTLATTTEKVSTLKRRINALLETIQRLFDTLVVTAEPSSSATRAGDDAEIFFKLYETIARQLESLQNEFDESLRDRTLLPLGLGGEIEAGTFVSVPELLRTKLTPEQERRNDEIDASFEKKARRGYSGEGGDEGDGTRDLVVSLGKASKSLNERLRRAELALLDVSFERRQKSRVGEVMGGEARSGGNPSLSASDLVVATTAATAGVASEGFKRWKGIVTGR